jgi:Fic family protein
MINLSIIMLKTRLFKRIEQIPSDIWLKINKIDELKGQWISGTELSPQVLGRLKKSVLITSTGSSTRIEGAKLSDKDIENMIKGLSVQKFADRDVQEVQGYYELLENVFNSWNKLIFSENTIKNFHKEILKYVEKDERHRGKYKTQDNNVKMFDEKGNTVGVLFKTTSAYLTPKEVQELIDCTKEAFEKELSHPLLIIANFIVEFLNIHPFIDGNGRTSRVLTNFLLLKAGYSYIPYISHEKLIELQKPEYYIALRRSQKTIKKKNENINEWLSFFFDILLEQSKQAIDLLSNESIEKLLSEKQLIIWKFLNTVDEVSASEIAKETGIVRITVNQVLEKLLKLKKIEMLGQGRSVRYRVI